MHTLSAADITRLCEWGTDKHDLDRAVALLRVATPGVEAEQLSLLPVGQRDERLMRLRARHFGQTFDMTVRCPKCDTALEFSMDIDALIQEPPEPSSRTIGFDGGSVQYRLPNSRDMAAINRIRDPSEARQLLLSRCLRVTDTEGQPTDAAGVPPEVLEDVVQRWASEDPQADITFKLTCVSCRHKWRSVFDILSYFWRELEIYSQRLQDEVHLIAGQYGWDEQTILRMTPERRKRYIDLIGT